MSWEKFINLSVQFNKTMWKNYRDAEDVAQRDGKKTGKNKNCTTENKDEILLITKWFHCKMPRFQKIDIQNWIIKRNCTSQFISKIIPRNGHASISLVIAFIRLESRILQK